MNYSKIQVPNGSTIFLNNSKSLLIRLLIATFLYKDEILDISADESEDVRTVHTALKSIRRARKLSRETTTAITANDCGAGYRFLLSVLATTDGNWILTGSSRLLKRPVRPLVSALLSIGADIDECECGLRIHGHPLQSKEMTIHCEESSQFASSLLLISHKIGLQQLHILPPTPPSMPYINMTRSVVNAMLGGSTVNLEADWSTAAFWYALVATSEKPRRLFLKNLRLDGLQGDRIAADLFAKMGVKSEQTEAGVWIEKHGNPRIGELDIDLTDNPDLAPVLSTTAVLYPFKLTLSGIGNLNFKESNRIDILTTTLARFAPTCYHCSKDDESLTIDGTRRYTLPEQVIPIDTWNDHRMVMAFALLTQRHRVLLADTHCVKKSYPEFENYLHAVQSVQK